MMTLLLQSDSQGSQDFHFLRHDIRKGAADSGRDSCLIKYFAEKAVTERSEIPRFEEFPSKTYVSINRDIMSTQQSYNHSNSHCSTPLLEVHQG